MNRANIAKVLVGTVGAVLTYVVAPPGEHILELGGLRFDPSLAVLAAFAFLTVYGIAIGVRRAIADGSELSIAGFGTTEILIILALAVVASAEAYTSIPTVTNVLFTFVFTIIGMVGLFLLFRYLGLWYPGRDENI